MRPPERRHPRAWTRDPFLFALCLTFLGSVTVLFAIAGRVFGDPALVGLSVLSVGPAFWLFHQRSQALAHGPPRDRHDRRRRR